MFDLQFSHSLTFFTQIFKILVEYALKANVNWVKFDQNSLSLTPSPLFVSEISKVDYTLFRSFRLYSEKLKPFSVKTFFTAYDFSWIIKTIC